MECNFADEEKKKDDYYDFIFVRRQEWERNCNSRTEPNGLR
jgi:hypothetical protein